MLFRRTRSFVIDGIEIHGAREFLLETQDSLALLRPTKQFEVIRANLGMIRQGKRSGMKAWAKKPTFIVGKATWKLSPLWYAGAIAHDAFHAKLYFDAKRENLNKEPDADAWTGAEAEKQCLTFQRQVLLALHADQKTIAYIEECAKNPTYQGRNKGWKSWLDYLKRWW
ncbi:MAG TPA: hypothetical protein VMO00_03610 [Methylomirabilota bacterium]|nr:hypothetical protein [Methylomirabilota bacterium]